VLIDTVKFLITAACQAPSADNSQPWHFTWDGLHLTLSYDVDRVSGQTFPSDDPATLLSVGGVIENLSQAADHIGLHIEEENISERELNTGTYFRYSIEPENLTRLPDNYADLALFNRHTNRFPFNSNTVDESLTAAISAESELDARALAITNPETIREIENLVRSASEIRFQTKEVHEWLGKSLRFSPREVQCGDGLDVATLNLPPGGGSFLKFISDWKRMKFLNRLGAYKALSIVDSAAIGKAPAVVIITCPKGVIPALAAGRLLTRVWIRLNAEGIAVHPYYVISDQLQRLQKGEVPEQLLPLARKLAVETNEIFGLDTRGEQLLMLLRVGHPKKIPVRSRRLPLEKVFTDES
jgi:hypothetical protein